MTAINPFVLEKEEYQRNLKLLRHYVEDTTLALMLSSGDPEDVCRKFVIEGLKPGGIFEFNDPEIVYLERQENGDRIEKTGTMMAYLQESLQNKEIIASTFTTYLPPETKLSLLVEFIDENVAARSRAKHAMFAAKMAGNGPEEAFQNCKQSNAKIANNSISGGHVSSSTPLYNKSAHSTLTSNCRITSGYGNANNEKMLSGNRHYHNPEIVMNNIVSIIKRSDMDKIQAVVDKYKLHYPTVDEAFDVCIGKQGGGQYWAGAVPRARIYDLLGKTTPLQRVAFVYTGDLYRLAQHNDAVVRDLIGSLSARVTAPEEADPLKLIKSYREEYVPLACQLWPDYMKGVDFKKIKRGEPGFEKHHERLQALAGTVRNIHETIIRYGDFIEAFFVTENVPPSLAFFPNSIRHSALTSDTDSTIFTVQDWVKWKTGRVSVDTETNGVAATMIFFAAEAIVHILARMSANLGIGTERIYQVAMKNEFKFDVFVPTQVGKHYYAYIGCQEGNLYIDYEMEIKGVHLKSSNVPSHVMAKAVAMMQAIMDAAARGEKISIYEKLAEVAAIEHEIERSLLAGESTYFRTGQIKTPSSYAKEPDQSPYQQHVFWNECFGGKYGAMAEPPYGIYKLAVNLKSQKTIVAWIDSIEDADIKRRLTEWNKRTQKATISTFLLSQQTVMSHGVPKEFHPIMDIRRAKIDCTMVFYLILETLGYYCINDKITDLVSDYY